MGKSPKTKNHLSRTMRIFPGFDMIAANPTFAHRNSLLNFVRNDIFFGWAVTLLIGSTLW
jgi:hypothetical protein